MREIMVELRNVTLSAEERETLRDEYRDVWLEEKRQVIAVVLPLQPHNVAVRKPVRI